MYSHLIFSSNTSLISDYGIEQSIHENCHHNIIFGKINFSIPLPPPYYREIWDFEHANIEGIQRTMSNFNWYNAFCNVNINEKVKIFNETILNIFRNFIPHKMKKFDYKKPPWMTQTIISSLRKISRLQKNIIIILLIPIRQY